MLPPAEPAKLALELAAGLIAIPDILANHGLARSELKQLLRDIQFRNMVTRRSASGARR